MTNTETAIPLPFEAVVAPALTETTDAERLAGLTSLRDIRRERNLTTVELSRISGISRDEIQALESGAPFNIDQIHALAAALGVPPETLTA